MPPFSFLTICTVASCFCAIIAGCKNTNSDYYVGMPVLSSNSILPVVSVYITPGMHSFQSSDISLMVAIWKDGQIIWSDDQMTGGPPYKSGKISNLAIQAFLDDLQNKGIFSNYRLNSPDYGPDSEFTTIAIADGNRLLNMSSWHELFEADSNLVATSHGITTITKGTREEILSNDTKEYQKYRQIWKEIRFAIKALIPKEGSLLEDITFSVKRINK